MYFDVLPSSVPFLFNYVMAFLMFYLQFGDGLYVP